MLFAYDCNDNRVHIEDTHSNQEYYCPYCGAPLITKKGDIRQHHFAHRAGCLCKDLWAKNNFYDMTPWHNEWQECYPLINQEIKLELGSNIHRADVLTGRTVVEFQHSILAVKVFDERNNFYSNLGYKVIWLFDLTKEIKNEEITYEKKEEYIKFFWKNPKKAFNSYDIKAGKIDLFFQLDDSYSDKIVRVLDVSKYGFEEFFTSDFISKEEFLKYTGLNNGNCLDPDRTYLEDNKNYLNFKEQYNISLNKQQERAVQAIEGAVLLLAVPGSGKTTVLITRLGYMIMEKGIAPEQILALTYTNNAADEMKERFCKKFDDDIGKRIDFRTINSLSLEIYKRFCKKINHPIRELIKSKDLKEVYKKVYRKTHENEIASENDIIDLETMISYSKNMMLDKKQISEEIDPNYSFFSDMYKEYKDLLDKKFLMDYDDQMQFANWILTEKEDERKYWQNKYKYICVDEAQDTSKIQHNIINILAQGNNIFMVGDEDQSIYGFRAAYPKALLNFRVDYINPFILRMEKNYRSTKQIVESAQTFISANKGRFNKNMISARGDGEEVKVIKVANIEAQYLKILEIAKQTNEESAFLYRDNESSVVLVDLFLRNNIKFYMRKPEMNFFNCKIVSDIIDYFTLVVDPYNYEAFSHICNHGIIYLKKQQKEYAINNCKRKHITIFEAIEEQMKYVKYNQKDQAYNFKEIITEISQKTPCDAIEYLLDSGYEKYIKENHYDMSKTTTLSILAKQETYIEKFLSRVKELENLIQHGFKKDKETYITLSTIHSSKGLEYNNVYMVDVYDGRFPSSKKNIFNRSKDNANDEQEERRMFYVGITRAKNILTLFYIKNRSCSYVEELFPNVKEKEIVEIEIKEQKQKDILRNDQVLPIKEIIKDQENQNYDVNYLSNEESSDEVNNGIEPPVINVPYNILEDRIKQIKKDREKIKIKTEQELFNEGYNEVKDKINQATEPVYDSKGNRWVKCKQCGLISTSDHFAIYGGSGVLSNLGLCQTCAGKKVK